MPAPASRHRALQLSVCGLFWRFGLTSAPMVTHFVHTMRGPNVGTVRSPGRWSTVTTLSARKCDMQKFTL
jgi:hypothetical protein